MGRGIAAYPGPYPYTPYPPPYPYPYAYQPPPPPPPSTPKGVDWITKAFAIYIAVIVVQGIVSILAFSALRNMQVQDPATILAALLPVLVGALVTGVLGLIVLIFYLIGYSALYKGRNEFGPAHARNVKLSFYLLILAIIVGIVGGVAGVIIGFIAMRFDPFTGGFTFDANMYYLSVAVDIASGIVIAALMAAHFVLGIRALAGPDDQRLLYIAAAIGTATPGVTGALVLLALPQLLPLLADPVNQGFSVGPEWGLPSLVGTGMNFATFLLFFLVYYRVNRRLRSGDLKPTLPQPQPMSWMPMPFAPPPGP